MRPSRHLVALALLALALPLARAQSPQQIVQQIVDTERTENRNDHSQWVYLDHTSKPKQNVLQWVASTPNGDIDRVLVRDGRDLPDPEQQSAIQNFLHDPRAQKKQLAESAHDYQQVDELLRLLPDGFTWTVLRATPDETTFHFVPNPAFHPPSHLARVFSAATGDLIADNHQHRIRSVHGTLIHDVTFGGGILGRLRQGGTFAIEQQQVEPALWQLTLIHIHLNGSALLFKSISFQEDEDRSRFAREHDNVTLDQAAQTVMRQPGSAPQTASR